MLLKNHSGVNDLLWWHLAPSEAGLNAKCSVSEVLTFQLTKSFCLSFGTSFFLAPTAAPLNLQVSNSSSTSFMLTWDPPPQNETNGFIRQYSIRYRRLICNSNLRSVLTDWTLIHVSRTARFGEIKGLAKWSCYAVQINAVTIKNGMWSEEIQRRTSEDGKINCTLYLCCTCYWKKKTPYEMFTCIAALL